MKDCRNCDFNTYKDIDEPNWVSCCHPTAVKKIAAWEVGDPAIVNYRTADFPMSDIRYMLDCPAWAPRVSPVPVSAATERNDAS